MSSSSMDSAKFQQMLEQEKQRAMVNEMVAKLTNICWDKCITGSVGSSFSNSETKLSEELCTEICGTKHVNNSEIQKHAKDVKNI